VAGGRSAFHIAIRGAHVAMVPVFALCAAVQLNDPDPLRWIAMYLAALIVAALGAAARPNPWLAGGVALVALAWAATEADSFVGCLGAGRACFSSWDMHGDSIAEEAREVGGLLIVAAWCGVAVAHAVAVRQKPRSAARPIGEP